MTRAATTLPQGAKHGPGRLVLIVGPSGAGKDTLIGLAQAACAGDAGIVFARRVVTREASPFENNEQISPDGFRQACDRGEFAVHWDAHGHSYGLRRSLDADIAAGRAVIANVSRTVIGELRGAYGRVTVVSITAPADVLAARLAGRSRASDGPSAARLARAVDSDQAADVTISNVGKAEHHADELLRVIRKE